MNLQSKTLYSCNVQIFLLHLITNKTSFANTFSNEKPAGNLKRIFYLLPATQPNITHHHPPRPRPRYWRPPGPCWPRPTWRWGRLPLVLQLPSQPTILRIRTMLSFLKNHQYKNYSYIIKYLKSLKSYISFPPITYLSKLPRWGRRELYFGIFQTSLQPGLGKPQKICRCLSNEI